MPAASAVRAAVLAALTSLMARTATSELWGVPVR